VQLTDDQIAIRELAREFARKEVLPVANELDPVAGEIPMALRHKLADVGFFGILIPEEYGGLGLGVLEYALITEELAGAWMSVSSLISRSQQFLEGWNDEMRFEKMGAAARGEYLCAFALSEPEAGSDAANVKCQAVRDGDEWVITGQKMWCTFADGAHYILLFARTGAPDPDRRANGISCFVVEKEPGPFPPGISGTPMRKIGYHGWKTWELSFDGFRIPAEALVGDEGAGFKIAMGNLDVARVHTAARAIGLARAALEDAVTYIGQRIQFDKPLAVNQALRFKIADMATQIEAARALTLDVARRIDAGERCSTEASMAKLFASEMAERVTSDALQMHGGAGYTKEFAVERHWRDARLTKIFEGASEIQQRIISDDILGRM
jgi:hypothetical protein